VARRPTATSAFGSSRRENHDASAFYARFAAPRLSDDDVVHPDKALDKVVLGDSRSMPEVPDASVALVVTSPPYFAGKEYELELGTAGVPSTYLEYLGMLREVFAECVRVLEPGGRIAVNVANLGRRPYRSLSSDVIGILQDDLGLLLRGEFVWVKGRGATGSCAWGSFQSPANPVVRDVTERIVVASKGRFDRAIPRRVRRDLGLPWEVSMTREDFLANTLDLWEFPPVHATRVGHPAPFPVELPARLIELYTYVGDLVLDPFLGSGSTAVAALRLGRHYVGYDTDEAYVRLAEERLANERLARVGGAPKPKLAADLEPGPTIGGPGGRRSRSRSRAGPAGTAEDVAIRALELAGFAKLERSVRAVRGVAVDVVAEDPSGRAWCFDVVGTLTSHRATGLGGDGLLAELGKAALLADRGGPPLVVLLAGDERAETSAARRLGPSCGRGRPLSAVVGLLSPFAVERLRSLAAAELDRGATGGVSGSGRESPRGRGAGRIEARRGARAAESDSLLMS
jgi:DNA modification methylase